MFSDPKKFQEHLDKIRQVTDSKMTIAKIAENHPDLISEIKSCHPFKSATIFSALLVNPEFQSNCLRLEWIIHLCIAYGAGSNIPTATQISSWYNIVGSSFGHFEDPAEDVFIDLITSPHGNFKVPVGIWTSGTFYTQRMINAVSRLKVANAADNILEPVYNLLRLSDALCEKLNLDRFILGNEHGTDEIPRSELKAAGRSKDKVSFTQDELVSLGINLDALVPFGFVPDARYILRDEDVGHTSLERCPLGHHEERVVILLPTAITVAIRRYIFGVFSSNDDEQRITALMALEYGEFLNDTPFFGGQRNLLPHFQKVGDNGVSSVVAQIDIGRYLQLIAVIDNHEGFSESGFAGMHPDRNAISSVVEYGIKQGYESVSTEPHFKEMISVIMPCGIGRGAAFSWSEKEYEGVRVMSLNPADYFTLTKDDNFTPYQFWRIVDAKDDLKKRNITLMNPSGFLNLAAWINAHNGHIVPDSAFSDDYDGAGLFFNFDFNAYREYRHKVFVETDEHYARYIDGEYLPVRHFSGGEFIEDQNTPIYAAMVWDDKYRLKLLYKSEHRNWWAAVSVPNTTDESMKQQKWDTVKTWLQRIVPVIEIHFASMTQTQSLLICNFLGVRANIIPDKKLDKSLLENCFDITSNKKDNTVKINFDAQFENFIYHGENIAERTLVGAVLSAYAQLFDLEITEKLHSQIVSEIVPNTLARQAHAFHAKGFRDMVSHTLPSRYQRNDIDEAAAITDIGWKARDRKLSNIIVGRELCTSYLNDTNAQLLKEVCGELNGYDRHDFIKNCILQYEASMVDRNKWRRTAAAVINLRKDQDAAAKVILDNEHDINSMLQANRILIEIGVCECPLKGGRPLGKIDHARLIAKIMNIIHIGGFSDAIHWEATIPEVRIAPLGEIHIDYTFHNEVMQPYITTGTKANIDDEVEKYALHTEQKEAGKPFGDVFEKDFLTALESHWGFTPTELRVFVEFIEDLGVLQDTAVLEKRYSELLDVKTDMGSINTATAKKIIEEFSLKPRESWSSVPEGHNGNDIFPATLIFVEKTTISIG